MLLAACRCRVSALASLVVPRRPLAAPALPHLFRQSSSAPASAAPSQNASPPQPAANSSPFAAANSASNGFSSEPHSLFSSSSSPAASATPLVSTIADIHQRRLAIQQQVKNINEEEEDDDYKKKTSRFAEFLFFPALLGSCFYLGQKAESVLLSVDQFLGDKHRFDLGFTLVEAEGELIGGEIARLESRHVELRHAQSGPALARVLAAFERCESVAQLSFVNAVNIDADAVLAALTRAPHIRTVNVRGGDGGFALPLLRALSTNALPHVEKLALRNAEVDSQMVPLLLQLVEQNRSLRALTVQVRLAHHADDGRSVLKALQHRLRELRPDVQIECRVYR